MGRPTTDGLGPTCRRVAQIRAVRVRTTPDCLRTWRMTPICSDATTTSFARTVPCGRDRGADPGDAGGAGGPEVVSEGHIHREDRSFALCGC